MSVVNSYTLTVTQADVLYVSHQITADLKKLAACYPRLLDSDEILRLNTAMGIFMLNDAVSRLGFSVEDPRDASLVYHELRYDIAYTGTGGRMGLGGGKLNPVWIPASAKFTPWVLWSTFMKGLPPSAQRQIVEGTGWNVPGSNPFTPKYSVDWTNRATYGSGALEAKSREYRHG